MRQRTPEVAGLPQPEPPVGPGVAGQLGIVDVAEIIEGGYREGAFVHPNVQPGSGDGGLPQNVRSWHVGRLAAGLVQVRSRLADAASFAGE